MIIIVNPNQKSNVALNLIQEEELYRTFKSVINQNQEILWQSCNHVNDDIGVQIFNTPKQNLQKKVLQKYQIIQEHQFYQHYLVSRHIYILELQFLQKLFLYRILCFMKKKNLESDLVSQRKNKSNSPTQIGFQRFYLVQPKKSKCCYDDGFFNRANNQRKVQQLHNFYDRHRLNTMAD